PNQIRRAPYQDPVTIDAENSGVRRLRARWWLEDMMDEGRGMGRQQPTSQTGGDKAWSTANGGTNSSAASRR
ncbi:unnamed protein product, partial [Citrullus colocynthis]